MPKEILIVQYSHPQPTTLYVILNDYPEWELFFASNKLEALYPKEFQKDIDLVVSNINMLMMQGLPF